MNLAAYGFDIARSIGDVLYMFSLGSEAKLRRVWFPLLSVIAVILLISVAYFVAVPPDTEQKIPNKDKLWQFVDDVLLGTSYPEEEEVITRWTRSPTISLFSPAEDYPKERDGKLLRSVVREVNKAMGSIGCKIRYIGIDKKGADIAIAMLPHGNFRYFSKIWGVTDEEYLSILENSQTYSYVFRNDDSSISKAIAVVSTNTSQSQRRALMLYELLRALGFHKPSPACPSSIFYRIQGQTAKNKRFVSIDRDVLRFLYSQLEPGDTWVPVWKAFQGLEPKQYGCAP